jgi:hypothetical protein
MNHNFLHPTKSKNIAALYNGIGVTAGMSGLLVAVGNVASNTLNSERVMTDTSIAGITSFAAGLAVSISVCRSTTNAALQEMHNPISFE